MFKKILVTAAVSMLAVSAFAVDASQADRPIELKDGSTVHVFNDGKMGMETKLGSVVGMPAGHVMETKDGQKIVMVGNEIARLNNTLRAEWRN
jgi:hypothetical protein